MHDFFLLVFATIFLCWIKRCNLSPLPLPLGFPVGFPDFSVSEAEILCSSLLLMIICRKNICILAWLLSRIISSDRKRTLKCHRCVSQQSFKSTSLFPDIRAEFPLRDPRFLRFEKKSGASVGEMILALFGIDRRMCTPPLPGETCHFGRWDFQAKRLPFLLACFLAFHWSAPWIKR